MPKDAPPNGDAPTERRPITVRIGGAAAAGIGDAGQPSPLALDQLLNTTADTMESPVR